MTTLDGFGKLTRAEICGDTKLFAAWLKAVIDSGQLTGEELRAGLVQATAGQAPAAVEDFTEEALEQAQELLNGWWGGISGADERALDLWLAQREAVKAANRILRAAARGEKF